MSSDTGSPKRVLVVDDSALIRRILTNIISSDERTVVADIANDGIEALKKIETGQFDVVTLDINMPRMDGFTALQEILKKPLPVVMISSLTAAEVTFRALEMGAVDFIAKPDRIDGSEAEFAKHLINTIYSAAQTDVERLLQKRKRTAGRTERPKQSLQSRVSNSILNENKTAIEDCCIAIGVSTGGPPALSGLLESVSQPLPPIVIVQHMPGTFTNAFAKRLDSKSMLSVKEASTGDELRHNQVLVAPGGKHLKLVRRGSCVRARVFDGPPVSSHRPSVDVMMKSAAEAYGERCLGVIMTGMGHDGVDGCLAIRERGGYVLGQDQESSDVYGMNKAAFTAGGVDMQFNLRDLPKLLQHKSRALFRSRRLGALVD